MLGLGTWIGPVPVHFGSGSGPVHWALGLGLGLDIGRWPVHLSGLAWAGMVLAGAGWDWLGLAGTGGDIGHWLGQVDQHWAWAWAWLNSIGHWL